MQVKIVNSRWKGNGILWPSNPKSNALKKEGEKTTLECLRHILGHILCQELKWKINISKMIDVNMLISKISPEIFEIFSYKEWNFRGKLF